MPCDAARHALCCAQGCARVTEVRGLCGAMGVLGNAEGGLWGGELLYTRAKLGRCVQCVTGRIR
ncbi:Variant-specific surface protein [Giardia duodenalis assemblage B]|uniref:Variant-specific surface protein n=1 Tax=Giardia duodenalis assemblage B TaxID=1394984 RepID=A0A132NMA1_GIAIN|nr:Variant-specific surface protein [Giardia intestinalis assemblage B]